MGAGSWALAVAAVAAAGTEQEVLQTAADACRAVAGARYAATLLLGPDGTPSGLAHTGMTARQVAVLPHLPRPVGLIGHVLTGHRLRLDRMADHPEAVGFPDRHAPMAALLGVPVEVGGRVLGGLYLTRGPEDPVFDDEDEAVAVALAAQVGAAASALRTAEAGRRLVDGLTGGSDEPSPTVRRLLATARELVGLSLACLAHIEDGTQTFTAVDAAPGAPALAEGTVISAADGLCARMLSGAVPSAVPDVRAHPELAALPAVRDLGVGAYCGVPVRLGDGSLFGTLCALDGEAVEPPTGGQLEAMSVAAAMLGQRIGAERADRAGDQRRRAAFREMVDGARTRIVLQPIVDLVSGRVAGYEALARFTDVAGAAWRPDLVFAEARSLGLGRHLELAAVRAALTLVPLVPPDAYLSVNLSPAVACDPDAFAALSQAPADRVVLELTEHEPVADYRTVVTALAHLRGLGMRLAVDDTGSGFAGLQHLAQLAPDIVKLDIAFVRGVHRDPTRRAVARAVTGFADEVGATLVAEGIEDPAELAELRRLGVRFGQGYLLGRPGEVADVLAGSPVGACAVVPDGG